MKKLGCSSENLSSTLKWDQSGCGSSFIRPLKDTTYNRTCRITNGCSGKEPAPLVDLTQETSGTQVEK